MSHKHTKAHTGDKTPPDFVTNHPHQHAFVLVGHETVFAVHMTQYHHEEHKYQLVMKMTLPPDVKSALDHARDMYPTDTFVLCNDDAESQLFMVPDLPAGRRPTFKANIFQGLPAFTNEEAEEPHFFPWDKVRTTPFIADFDVTVERIVTYRPFAHHLKQPDFATYLLWGDGEEAHMTNLQTAALASGKFEVPAFGPDYDHVMSLKEAPAWLDKPLLEAGVVVSVPGLRLNDAKTGAPTIPTDVPIAPGQKIDVLYRGMGPVRTVWAGQTFLAATAVCNSPGVLDGVSLIISATPEKPEHD
ncbi:hypothetical protein [Loktanella sp. SALINAS62]|uniref:hypothetical protein n=1 Tax=Loktanella sp. SALINAS62 TaxID=2706124 RepID=UPI001B8DAA14|nr:hypothetical protein [Loktanella sp. SALINAS62]MBS1304281.1 hypothetical protein [Loktanella sp. SALINAS62]